MQNMMTNISETFVVDQVNTPAVDVNGTLPVYTFCVADGLTKELIIDAGMMQKFKISLDLDDEAVSIDSLTRKHCI